MSCTVADLSAGASALAEFTRQIGEFTYDHPDAISGLLTVPRHGIYA